MLHLLLLAEDGNAAPEMPVPPLEDAEALEREGGGDGEIDVTQIKQHTARHHRAGGHAVDEQRALIDHGGVEPEPKQIRQHEQADAHGRGELLGVRGHPDVRALAGYEARREIHEIEEGETAQFFRKREPVPEREPDDHLRHEHDHDADEQDAAERVFKVNVEPCKQILHSGTPEGRSGPKAAPSNLAYLGSWRPSVFMNASTISRFLIWG